MKKSLTILLAMSIIVFLAACGGEKNKEDAETDDVKVLEVELEVPKTADPDEEVEMKATVTYGDEKVTDADEVEFEIWEDGKKEDSEKVEATNHEDGTYTATTSFEKDGLYTVQVHVTARDQHTMPMENITVGAGAAEHDEEGHDKHDSAGFGIHFMQPEDVTATDDVELTVHLQMDQEPFENAKVRYQIAAEDHDIHDWVDAEPTSSAGEYRANYQFSKAGTYQIVIHVEDDNNLHEHEEYTVEVQE